MAHNVIVCVSALKHLLLHSPRKPLAPTAHSGTFQPGTKPNGLPYKRAGRTHTIGT